MSLINCMIARIQQDAIAQLILDVPKTTLEDTSAMRHWFGTNAPASNRTRSQRGNRIFHDFDT